MFIGFSYTKLIHTAPLAIAGDQPQQLGPGLRKRAHQESKVAASDNTVTVKRVADYLPEKTIEKTMNPKDGKQPGLVVVDS